MSELAQAEYKFNGSNSVVTATHGSDAGCYVEFRMEAIHQEFESNKENRPIYKDVPFIKIMFPGDKNKVIDRPVQMEEVGGVPPDTWRWKTQWEQFKAQETQVTAGDPIGNLPNLTKSQVMEFKLMGIHTVEALAAVSDVALSGMGHGASLYRKQAQDRLTAQAGGKVEAQLRTHNEALQAQIDALTKQMADLMERVPDEVKRGPGRPPKAA